MGLIWLIVLIALVAIAVWIVVTLLRAQQGVRAGSVRPRDADPEQILAERLARGDIDPEEYRVRVRTLRDHHGP